VIEVEVHQQLRAFLREQGEPYWHHHLTMARLVARALRIGRSALIQAGAPSGYHGGYRLSYLMPLLLWPEPTVLVVTEAVQQRLLMVEIPRLHQWIPAQKAIRTGDRWPSDSFQGLLLTSPEAWLGDRLAGTGLFPDDIPTVIDSADNLETWVYQQLTAQIHPHDWEDLMRACPTQAEAIRDARVRLTRSVFQHPVNPYNAYLVEAPEESILTQLYQELRLTHTLSDAEAEDHWLNCNFLPAVWQQFGKALQLSDRLLWTEVNRQQGQFSLHCSPLEIAPALSQIWFQQPIVLIGGFLDLESEATTYRQRLGLQEDMTCLKFCPDRQHELIQLYLPDGLPMPNTPQFQPALLQEIRTLIGSTHTARQGLTVILVSDTPLKAQVGSVLAAEFGSRVQVEKTCLDEQGILVSDWEFWQQHQAVLPAPRLLMITTLPFPSLEEPWVAGRVAYYKRSRQDWFRLYLLPEALGTLQRAIAPVRDAQGVVALLDSRVNHRSYGQQVLAALSPMARINYVDASVFTPLEEMGMPD
jgi:ATP-dependent DNA helicase DinG